MTLETDIVIVVDDNPKFVHHVFRHLTQTFEFGFAGKASDALVFPPRTSADGRLTVEWHDPRATATACADARLKAFERRLEELKAIKNCDVWALIDIYGVGGPGPDDWLRYVHAWLRIVGRLRVRVVSSYSRHVDPVDAPDGEPFPITIHPKSPETLGKLRATITQRTSFAAPAASSTVHVLVTGAGFELADAAECGLVTGVPFTDQLLQESGATIRIEGGYPLPGGGLDFPELVEAARNKDLDAYWEHRLRRFALVSRAGRPSDPGLQYDIVQNELDEREAFRTALLRYDVGYLAQALWASQLDWSFWLSTNYTRFADRAVEFLRDFAPVTESRAWHIMSTPIEAQLINSSVGLHKIRPTAKRWLIKLHGDIGQTQSMVLTASDKGLGLGFAVSPQLESMYGLAKELILQRLELAHERPDAAETCHWHVLGHALRDQPLLHLLQDVQARSPRVWKHIVTIVAPDASEILDRLRADRLETIRSAHTHFEALDTTARSYMGHLRERGLPDGERARSALFQQVRAHAVRRS
jgi:hypothetical protein